MILLIYLKTLYLQKKYFSQDVLNFRINAFHYGLDLTNKPPILSANFEKKRKLSMAASKMKCFIKYFAFIIRDLIPEGDSLYELYLCLREILDIVLANVISVETSQLLDVLVSEHNELFINLFNEFLTSLRTYYEKRRSS